MGVEERDIQGSQAWRNGEHLKEFLSERVM